MGGFLSRTFVLKKVRKGLINNLCKFLLVRAFVRRIHFVTRKKRIGYIFLANVRWIPYHNIEASTSIIAKYLHKTNVPDKRYALRVLKIMASFLQLTEHIFLLRKDRKSTRLNSSHVKISYAV